MELTEVRREVKGNSPLPSTGGQRIKQKRRDQGQEQSWERE